MNKLYTKKGWELKLKNIKLQEEKVKKIGCEVGEEAGANCDWHDNFGYEDSKRKLELESEILRNLNKDIEDAEIIEIKEQNNIVAIGTTVNILINDAEKEYMIGGWGESDTHLKLISYNSPIGSALMNMKIGESKEVKIGPKNIDLKIVDIKPPSKYVI